MTLTIALLLATLQIRVVAGEGAVHEPGLKSSPGLLVEVTDATGQAVAGAPVAFRLPPGGPSGEFLNGLRTEIARTGPDGRAAAPIIRWNRTGGALDIRVAVAREGERAATVVRQHVAEPKVGTMAK